MRVLLAFVLLVSSAAAEIIDLDRHVGDVRGTGFMSLEVDTATQAIRFSELWKYATHDRIGTRGPLYSIVTPPTNPFGEPTTRRLGIGIYGRVDLLGEDRNVSTDWLDRVGGVWPVPDYSPAVNVAQFTAYVYEQRTFGNWIREEIIQEMDLGIRLVDLTNTPAADVVLSGTAPYLTWTVSGPEALYTPQQPVEFDWRFDDGTQASLTFNTELQVTSRYSSWHMVPEPAAFSLSALAAILLGYIRRQH